jgi:putative transposase
MRGATGPGAKEWVGLWDGSAERAPSWKALLCARKSHGLTRGPVRAMGEGAWGFWKALPQACGRTKRPRCGVPKTDHVWDKLPEDMRGQAKQRLQAMWMAPERARAERACDLCVATDEQKYPQAVACLSKDRDPLLAFYDFPAEHWRHMRTTNPIASTCATGRMRTDKTQGCLSRETTLTMGCKLFESAQKRWRRLHGAQYRLDVLEGIAFQDGIRVEPDAA